MSAPGMEKAFKCVMKWKERPEWSGRFVQVFDDHIGPVCDDFDISVDDLIEEIGGNLVAAAFACAMDDFVTCEFEPDDSNVIVDYLARRGWKESVPTKRCLEAMCSSVTSLYEVTGLAEGSHLFMKDIVRGGDPVRVEDREGSQTAKIWDRIAARIVQVHGKNYLMPGILDFEMDDAEDLLEALQWEVKEGRKEFRKAAKGRKGNEVVAGLVEDAVLQNMAPAITHLWLASALDAMRQPPPRLVNLEGDDLLFGEVRYSIAKARTAEAERCLDRIADMDRDPGGAPLWQWAGREAPMPAGACEGKPRDGLSYGSIDDMDRLTFGTVEIQDEELVLRTNSRERTELGMDMLKGPLDGLVGEALVSFHEIGDVTEDAGELPGAGAAEEIPPEEAARIFAEYFERHYRDLLSQPVPMLDGKTPRAAARSKAGRARLVGWLKNLENTEARRAKSQGQEPCETAWLWEELGVFELRDHAE